MFWQEPRHLNGRSPWRGYGYNTFSVNWTFWESGYRSKIVKKRTRKDRISKNNIQVVLTDIFKRQERVFNALACANMM